MYKIIWLSENGGNMDMGPEHPGKILDSLLQKHGWNITQFAGIIGVSTSRISEILSGKRRITVDTAIRIANALDMTPEYWLNRQNEFDIYARNLLG